jgi:hypothetical protein
MNVYQMPILAYHAVDCYVHNDRPTKGNILDTFAYLEKEYGLIYSPNVAVSLVGTVAFLAVDEKLLTEFILRWS